MLTVQGPPINNGFEIWLKAIITDQFGNVINCEKVPDEETFDLISVFTAVDSCVIG